MTHRIQHDPQQSRFEVYAGDALAGYADYVEANGVRDFHHTVTIPEFRGHGIAGEVVRFALDDTRERGLKIVPSCWYVEKFIGDNPEYKELLA